MKLLPCRVSLQQHQGTHTKQCRYFKSFYQLLEVAEHSFLVPLRYSQTTGSWAAKIGKM